MTTHSSRKITAFLFVFIISAYFLTNVIVQRYFLYYGFLDIEQPESPEGVLMSIAKTEDLINRSSYRRDNIVNFYAYIQKLLGKEENGGYDIVLAHDGSLHNGDFYQAIPEQLEEYALRLRRLKDYAGEAGCQLVFLNNLPKYTKGYDKFTPGLPYRDDNPVMDAMLFYLQSYDVDYVDFRDLIEQSDLPPEEYRYKTDHHWTIEASFECFKSLTNILEERYGKSIDPNGIYTNLENYTRICYPGSLTGTMGNRSGYAFAGSEDFTMLLPKFDTAFYVEMENGKGIETYEGSFEDALINVDFLYTYNMYLSYLNGLSAYKHIVNLNGRNGLKALFIHDSTALPLAAFMSTAFQETDMIYPISQYLFDYFIDVEQYLMENASQYDFIFIELVIDNFTDDAFSFFKE